MKTLAIILAIFLVVPSTAMAVRKVEKKPKAQAPSTSSLKADQSRQESNKSVKTDQPQSTEPQKDQAQSAKEAPGQSAKGITAKETPKPDKEDRFIDENGDGINDRIDEKQTVKIRKKEESRREAPTVKSPKPESSKREIPKRESPKRESSAKTDKPERRDR